MVEVEVAMTACRRSARRRPSSPMPSTRGRTHLVTTTRRAQQQQQSTRGRTHIPIVVAVGLFRNAVLADAVDTRTHTPRHNHTQGAAVEEEDVAPRDNAPP